MSTLDARDIDRGRPPDHAVLELDGERTTESHPIVDPSLRGDAGDTGVMDDDQVVVTRVVEPRQSTPVRE